MTKIGNDFAALLLAFCLATPAFADEAPPRVTEAFQYVVTDTGQALEIDWAIDECCYLYRDKLSFESGDSVLVFGDFRLPEGLPHEDEFFGKQQVYRDRFFVTIPYTVKGNRPQTAELVIKSQGCNDVIGICYPPQTWVDEVKLRKVDSGTPKLKLGQLSGTPGINSEFPPVDEVFFPEIFPVDGNTVEVGIRVVPGFYLYKDKISVRSLSDDAKAGRLDLPQGKMKVDEYFGEMEVYVDSILAPLAVARATPEAMDLELELKYQGCAEGGLCYMPQTRVITVSLPEASAVSDLAALPSGTAPVSEQARLAQIITGSSIWVTIGLFFLAGLGLAFTPCVLPMVPILSGIIAGEGDDVTPMRGFTLALSYVLGMALVYTGAGIAAAAAGMQLQATFNQPWILILFAGVFVILALGMFGAYELQMPSSIQGKVSSVSGKQKSGTMIGAFVMGALSALIVTACVAPALIAALTVMAQTGDMLRSGTALFAMSLGMGAPLLLVGAAQGKLLPKAGPWMVAVRNAFGFMMLGLAIWMLSRILSGNVTMLLWAVLIFMGGVFMGGLTTLTGESAVAQKLGKGFGFLAIIYGIILLLGALTGGSNPLQPLASINLGGATTVAEAEHALPFRRIKTVDDLDRELAAASGQGKSAFLDFYADWCVSCKEMEAYTFTDGDVQAALSNTVWLQADVTANDEADQALLDRFGVFGPPTIIFFGTDGQQRHGYEVVGYMKAPDFAEHLRQALGDATAISVQASH
ncbi:MAG: protein-disulfide reductase DsbD [Gammaproteobacteria bacterium]|nr:protein-disulfide reductase DsbD [Gammaproteobacteria bacterium]MDH3576487.1 protein-disulfide reductase DsbD [Gammaproteobacteria bacterium]